MNRSNQQSVWLPAAVYEALPYVYLVAGMSLLAGLAYIGVYSSMGAVYAVAGVGALIAGVLVLRRRNQARRGKGEG